MVGLVDLVATVAAEAVLVPGSDFVERHELPEPAPVGVVAGRQQVELAADSAVVVDSSDPAGPGYYFHLVLERLPVVASPFAA